MQKIEFRSSPSADIVIEPFERTRFATFRSEFPEEINSLEPVSFVFTNKTSRKIVGIAIRWIVVDSEGHERRINLRSDSFMTTTGDPVALPQTRLLAGPGAIMPESLVGRSSIGPGISSRSPYPRMIREASAVSIEVDSVIFEDGEVIGPNALGFDSEITARYEAARNVAKLARDALAQGKTVSSVLAPIVNEIPLKSDHLKVWMGQYAEDVMNNRNHEKMALQLEKMSKPPEFFRRLDG